MPNTSADLFFENGMYFWATKSKARKMEWMNGMKYSWEMKKYSAVAGNQIAFD